MTKSKIVSVYIGMGDMAISNCLGSNIFDILLGLSLPWFLKTGIAYSGTTVSIRWQLFFLVRLFFHYSVISNGDQIARM